MVCTATPSERHAHPVKTQHLHMGPLDSRQTPPRNAHRVQRLNHKQANCQLIGRRQPPSRKYDLISERCNPTATLTSVQKLGREQMIRLPLGVAFITLARCRGVRVRTILRSASGPQAQLPLLNGGVRSSSTGHRATASWCQCGSGGSFRGPFTFLRAGALRRAALYRCMNIFSRVSLGAN